MIIERSREITCANKRDEIREKYAKVDADGEAKRKLATCRVILTLILFPLMKAFSSA